MEKLIRSVDKVILEELGRDMHKHGTVNHSDYESYALILEALEDGKSELGHTLQAAEEFWRFVKVKGADERKLKLLDNLQAKAWLAACAFIQVAAMARKATITIENKEEEKQ